MRLLSLNSVPSPFRTLSVLTGGLMLFAGPVNSSAFPDPAVEARTARELLAVESEATKPDRGSDTDQIRANIATSLARLGRLEAALKVVGRMGIQDADAHNGAPYTRAEVLRLVVRRRCVFGKLEEARQLIPAIADPSLRADALLSLARAYLRAGDYEKAQQTLYQVSPLVEKRVDATSYTAYVLSKSGDLEGAKRLFARAQTQLTPFTPLKKPENEPWHDMQASSERSALINYMFKSGLVDEAIRVEQTTRSAHKNDFFRPIITVDKLIKVNRFADALRVAREGNGIGRVTSLVNLASKLYEQQKDREGALTLLTEAEAEYRRITKDLLASGQQTAHERNDFGRRILPMAFMASVLHEIGEEEKAKGLREEALQDIPPEMEALTEFYLTFIPFAVRYERNAIMPLAVVKQIDAETQILLPKLKDMEIGFGLCQWLVQAYQKIGRKEEVRSYLPTLERFAFARIRKGEDVNAYTPVFQVAFLWWQMGDEAQVQRILQKVDRMSLPKNVTRHDVARLMIANGLIDEGRHRWEALPKLSARRYYSPELGYWEARHQPHIFPARIAKIPEHRIRLNELVSFTNGLTIPIYEIPEERELVLSRGGASSSY